MLALLLTAMATVSVHPVIVATGDLEALTHAALVDARDSKAFSQEHLAGAASLDYGELSEERDGVSGMLKPVDALLPLLAGAGIDPEKTVVVYGGMEDSGSVVAATRLFWVLDYLGYPDVRLLDGGLAKWKAEGRPLEAGASTASPVSVERLRGLKPVEARLATRDDVEAAREAKGLLFDLRGADYFSGEKKSGSVARAGHISGAKSLPGSEFLDEPYFTFKSPEAIREMLTGAGSAPDKHAITYCNSGRVATVGYVAHRVAGFDDVAVYDGSMTEWGLHEECPVATGAAE